MLFIQCWASPGACISHNLVHPVNLTVFKHSNIILSSFAMDCYASGAPPQHLQQSKMFAPWSLMPWLSAGGHNGQHYPTHGSAAARLVPPAAARVSAVCLSVHSSAFNPPKFEDRSRFIESGIIFKSVSNFCSALVCMQALQIEPPSRNSHSSADFQPPNSPNNTPPAPVSNGEPGAIAAIGNEQIDVFCLLQTLMRSTSTPGQPVPGFSAFYPPWSTCMSVVRGERERSMAPGICCIAFQYWFCVSPRSVVSGRQRERVGIPPPSGGTVSA